MLEYAASPASPKLLPISTLLDPLERSAQVTVIAAIEPYRPAFHWPGQLMGSFNILREYRAL